MLKDKMVIICIYGQERWKEKGKAIEQPFTDENLVITKWYQSTQ